MGDKFKDRVDVPFSEQEVCTSGEPERFDGDEFYRHDFPGMHDDGLALIFVCAVVGIVNDAAAALFNLPYGGFVCGWYCHWAQIVD